jgi:hypothetical protein
MAAIQVTMDQAMMDLSYLLGETSVPIPSPPDREAFIQRTLERVYRAYNWDLADVNATLQLTNGVANFPADVNINDPILDIRIKNDLPGEGIGGDFIFTKIPYEQQDSFGPSDYVYWVTGSPGAYVLNTAQGTDATTGNAILTIRYMQIAPTINSSIGTPFPSSMCLARGALAYYRQAEDPQADISQVESLFQMELEELISTQIRNQADHPAITRQQLRGTYTGDIGLTQSGMDDMGQAL